VTIPSGSKVLAVVSSIVLSVFLLAFSFADSNIRNLQSDREKLDKSLEGIQQFRDQGGIALGCFNDGEVPHLQSSLEDNPKVKLLQEFAESSHKLAHAAQAVVTTQEAYLNDRWSKPSWDIKILPWYNGRYSKLRDEMNARLAWAKIELADHSCTKN
jgi:hypothetical protein